MFFLLLLRVVCTIQENPATPEFSVGIIVIGNRFEHELHNMPGPLEGIKVLDITAFINGPSATGQMAENGAEVLKVEPKNGEGMRTAAGASGVYFAGFELFNRGKKSMTLDLKHPDSKEVMKRLVKWADVLAENFKPGTLDGLGFSYDVCKKEPTAYLCFEFR